MSSHLRKNGRFEKHAFTRTLSGDALAEPGKCQIDWARERRANKDIPLRQYSCHKQDIWNVLGTMKWEGMPRDDVPLSEQKSRKLVYGDGKS